MSLAEQIVEVLRSVLPPAQSTALHEPCFRGREEEYVRDCVTSGWVSSLGQYVDRFEQMLADYTGAARAVAVVNGTAALQVALQVAGVRPGDEVLLPALTFVATANAAVHAGAIPHLVDCSAETLGLDPERLDSYLGEIGEKRGDGLVNRISGRPLKAVLPMHTFGHPVDLDPLMAVCQDWGLVMVEDAAESLGSFYMGRHTGNWGRLSTLSFNGNKIITTGGGGAILTNDAKLADLAKHLTTTARQPHGWAFFHDQVGYNYRLPNINAALGCAQMEQLELFLAAKRALALRYKDAFAGMAGVSFFREPPFASSNYWLNVLLLDPGRESELQGVLEATNQAGFMTRPAWELMHRLPMYADCPRMDLPVAQSLAARIINLPSSPQLAL